MKRKWAMAAPWTPTTTSHELRARKVFASSVVFTGRMTSTSNPISSAARTNSPSFVIALDPFLETITSFGLVKSRVSTFVASVLTDVFDFDRASRSSSSIKPLMRGQ
ncbi:large-conductance mechanosensitive channel [Striga asiatica]|uniref:Large-conductance mechanosensitive channel n=1 Tax=Striga asiatica TaxID=4170 RepID=A0A5A7NZ85_STRAF|nr:large-conductance mechanosensitive channel [Striga asiatica]